MGKIKKLEDNLRAAEKRQKKAEEELTLAKQSVFNAKIKMMIDFAMYEQIDQTLKLYRHLRTDETQRLIRFAHSLDNRIKRQNGETDSDIMKKIARVLSFAYCKIHQKQFIAVDDLEKSKLNVTYQQIEKEIKSVGLRGEVDWGVLYRFFMFDNFNPLVDMYVALHTLYGLEGEKAQTQRAKKVFRPSQELPVASWKKFKQLLMVSPVKPKTNFLLVLNNYREGDDIKYKEFCEDLVANLNPADLRPKMKHFTTHLNMMILIAVHWKMNNYNGDDKPALDPTIEYVINAFKERMIDGISKQTIYKLYAKFESFYEKHYSLEPVQTALNNS